EYARADTERNQRLFDWALGVLQRLGIDKVIAAARTPEELRRVTFDATSAGGILAIRDALHPASGRRGEHFRGLKQGGLKQILGNRFVDLKKQRLAALQQRQKRYRRSDWSEQLILNKRGEIIANLANLVLMLREAPKWKGVLGYDEFAAR